MTRKEKQPTPFTRSVPGDGGVPRGRPGTRLDNPAGGRHAGALLADPEQTLEKGTRRRGNPGGVKKSDAAFPREDE